MPFISFFFIPVISIVFLVLATSISGNIILKGVGFKQPLWSFEWSALQSLAALSLFISLYAIVFTSGKTIFIAVIPLLCILLLLKRKSKKQLETKSNSSDGFGGYLIQTLLITVLICFYNYFECIDNAIIINARHYSGDYVFYSKVSYYLGKNGEENIYNYLNDLLPVYKGYVPYHYFELWLNNVLLSILHINSIHCLHLITFPFLLVLILLTLWGWIKSLLPGIRLLFKGLLLAALFFFGGVFFNFYNIIPKISSAQNFIYSLSSFSAAKLLVPSVFLIAIITSITKKEYLLCIFYCILLATAYTPVLPALMLGTPIFIVSTYFVNKDWDVKFQFVVLTLIAFLLTYTLTVIYPAPPVNKSLINMLSPTFILADFHLADIRTVLNIGAGTILNIALVYLFPLLILFFNWKLLWKEQFTKVIILFLSSLFFASLITWCIFFKDLNSNQLFYNLALPCINISFCFLFLCILRFPVKYKYLTVMFILCAIFSVTALNNRISINNYPNNITYINESVKLYNKYIKETNAKLGIVLLGKNDYNSIFKYNQTSLPGEYLFAADQDSKLVSLGDFSMPFSSDNKLDSIRKMNGFNIGFYKNYVEHKFSSVQSKIVANCFNSHKKFIQENHILYGIYSKNYPYSDSLQSMITYKVMDPISGETFFLLKM